MSEVIKNFKSSVEKSIAFYKEELKGVRTGRASVAMFENIANFTKNVFELRCHSE